MQLLRIGVVLGLLLTASACGSEGDTSTPTETPAATIAPTTEPATTDSTAVTPTTEPSSPGTTTTTSTTQLVTTTTEPAAVDVRVYLLRGERLAITHRDVAGPAVLRGTLAELLAGPTAAEVAGGIFTEIPDATTLLDVNLDAGIATVDLSGEFESGGGSMSMQARLAQVVFTATQFDNVDSVLFWMNGEPIDFFGGEGITLDQPQDRSGTPRDLTGGVLFDLPAPGSTVTNPFTVTGEGDVFEGDFPLLVRRDGVQLGDILVVRAGAWGDWRDFVTVVTVDADPGPIELIATDGSGCGPPECPMPTEIVLSLVLAD